MTKLIPVVLISLAFALFYELFSRKDELGNSYIYKEKLLWFPIIVVLAVFAGLRTRYNDTFPYLEAYNFLFNSDFDYSEISWSLGDNPGFNFVTITLKSLKFTQNGYLMFFSIITYSIYIWFIHKYSTDFLMSMFLFMCLIFTFPMAAIKQCVAIAFCLIAVDRAVNKKWVWFCFWLVIAMLFHAYSFVYIVVPLLFFIPWTDKKTYYWIAIFFIAGISLKPLLGTVLSVTDMLGDNYTAESFSGEGVNPFRVIVCLMPLIISFVLRKKINDPRFDMKTEEGLFMNLSFLNGEIMFVALFGTANYFARLANYFYIFPIITLPRLFNMVSPKWRFPLKVAAVVCYCYFFYYSNVKAGWADFDHLFERIHLENFHWIVQQD